MHVYSKVTNSAMLALGIMTQAMAVTLKHFTNRFQHFVTSKSKANIGSLYPVRH